MAPFVPLLQDGGIVQNDARIGEAPKVFRNARPVEGDHDVHRVTGGGNGPVRQAHLEDVVASPDARFIVLMDEYVVPRPGKDSREAVPDRLDALTGFAPYLDGKVQSPCLREVEKWGFTTEEM